jgi:hypothetical protein
VRLCEQDECMYEGGWVGGQISGWWWWVSCGRVWVCGMGARAGELVCDEWVWRWWRHVLGGGGTRE